MGTRFKVFVERMSPLGRCNEVVLFDSRIPYHALNEAILQQFEHSLMVKLRGIVTVQVFDFERI